MSLIKCQQSILKDLGLYQGKIEGAWGIKSMSAMAGLQDTTTFAGLRRRPGNEPFAPFEPLPKGWTWSEDGTSISVSAVEAIAPINAPVAAPPVEAAALVEEVVVPVVDAPVEPEQVVVVDSPVASVQSEPTEGKPVFKKK
jgi:hypothetical protein